MPVDTGDALTITAGQTYRLNRAIERMSRTAIGRMTQLATIYRPSDVVGGNSRLQEDTITVATNVPCIIEGWRMPTEAEADSAYNYQMADKRGHFALDAEIRRNDTIVIDGATYIVEGLLGATGNLVEQVVALRTSLGDGESIL
jgi:hypothetical protein